MGILITVISVTGIISSIIALFITRKNFAKQRKKLLESIKMEL